MLVEKIVERKFQEKSSAEASLISFVPIKIGVFIIFCFSPFFPLIITVFSLPMDGRMVKRILNLQKCNH